MVPSTREQPTDTLSTYAKAHVHISTHIAMPAWPHRRHRRQETWSATAVSIVEQEVPLLSGSNSQRYRAMDVSTLIVLIGPVCGLSWRSFWQHYKVCKRHDHKEQQHGDMAWMEPTITPPRVHSQVPFINAFEFEDERHGVLMLGTSPTRWAQRRRVRETALSICRRSVQY